MPQEGKAYIHAALALYFAGKPITEENLRSVIKAIGLNVDDVRIKMIVASLSEINIEEVLKQAVAAPVAAPVAVQAAAPAAAPAAAEERKEEKKEEEEKREEVDIAAGLESLFGF
jgi:large subunit ribosomal protein L12